MVPAFSWQQSQVEGAGWDRWTSISASAPSHTCSSTGDACLPISEAAEKEEREKKAAEEMAAKSPAVDGPNSGPLETIDEDKKSWAYPTVLLTLKITSSASLYN